MRFRPIIPQDRTRNIAINVVFLGLVLSLVFANIAFNSPLLAIVLLLFCLVSAVVLTKWAVDTYGYECSSCKHQFEIGLRTALLTPHVLDKKLLRCPSCGKRDWAKVVVKLHYHE